MWKKRWRWNERDADVQIKGLEGKGAERETCVYCSGWMGRIRKEVCRVITERLPLAWGLMITSLALEVGAFIVTFYSSRQWAGFQMPPLAFRCIILDYFIATRSQQNSFDSRVTEVLCNRLLRYCFSFIEPHCYQRLNITPWANQIV